MAQHTNYWSCTPFADWLRGTKKLSAGTSEEWDDWTTAAQMKHNFRYWLAEEGLGHIQDFVTWPVRKIYDVKYYINNRWVTRTHSLTAHARDIKPGAWRDVGNRFLPCLFNELVDFVEVRADHGVLGVFIDARFVLDVLGAVGVPQCAHRLLHIGRRRTKIGNHHLQDGFFPRVNSRAMHGR